MVNKRTHTCSLLLLGVIVLQLVLPVFIFFSVQVVHVLQHIALSKHEPDEEKGYAHFVLPVADAGRVYAEGGEMERNGVLYDIESVRIENGLYIITALADKTETGLQRLSTKVNGENRPKTALHKQQVVFSFFYFEQPCLWLPRKTTYCRLSFTEFAKDLPADVPLQLPKPPPWCA